MAAKQEAYQFGKSHPFFALAHGDAFIQPVGQSTQEMFFRLLHLFRIKLPQDRRGHHRQELDAVWVGDEQ